MQQDIAKIGDDREFKGWHALLWFLGFFGLMFVVNGIFLFHAINSFPGEDVKKSYVQGLNYNETLEARAMQAELGWTAQIGLLEGDLVFRLDDKSSAPVTGLRPNATLRRPATNGADVSVPLIETTPGEYRAALSGNLKGVWDVRVRTEGGAVDVSDFEARKTLFVP